MMYYLLRIREDGISRDMVLVFSVSSLLVSISVFVELFWGNETYLMDNLLLADGSLQSWLILVITVNAVGYCIYGSRKYWYGCNAVLNFFLLFLVKNVISIILVGSMLLMIPLVYVPTKRLVRSSMQLFFVFSFLLCSMSLLTGYSGLFEGIVTYHLEVSVYVGVILALFFALFFIFWKKFRMITVIVFCCI